MTTYYVNSVDFYKQNRKLGIVIIILSNGFGLIGVIIVMMF
ncbi:hypothetical protein [Clostridium kluyveri]|nr:hypothetical protein [Clostridium kluyveri]UZQ49124.1 hypothetical protein OP486_14300 [Clostridium kluyveri]